MNTAIQQLPLGVSERVYFKFYNASGALTNPDSTPFFTLKDKSGNIISDINAVSLSDVSLVNETTGIYYYDIILSSGQTTGLIYAFPEATINGAKLTLDVPVALEAIEDSAVPSDQLLTDLFLCKDYLDIKDTTRDILLSNIITFVSGRIETFCKRKFKARQYTAQYDGDGKSGRLFLENPPVTCTTLYDDTDREFGSSTKYATNEFLVYASEGYIELTADISSSIYLNSYFAKGQQNIKATWTGGYDDIPDEIKWAATAWVAAEFKKVEEKRWSLEGRSKGDMAETFTWPKGMMPKEVRELLLPFKMDSLLKGVG